MVENAFSDPRDSDMEFLARVGTSESNILLCQNPQGLPPSPLGHHVDWFIIKSAGDISINVNERYPVILTVVSIVSIYLASSIHSFYIMFFFQITCISSIVSSF